MIKRPIVQVNIEFFGEGVTLPMVWFMRKQYPDAPKEVKTIARSYPAKNSWVLETILNYIVKYAEDKRPYITDKGTRYLFIKATKEEEFKHDSAVRALRRAEEKQKRDRKPLRRFLKWLGFL